MGFCGLGETYEDGVVFDFGALGIGLWVGCLRKAGGCIIIAIVRNASELLIGHSCFGSSPRRCGAALALHVDACGNVRVLGWIGGHRGRGVRFPWAPRAAPAGAHLGRNPESGTNKMELNFGTSGQARRGKVSRGGRTHFRKRLSSAGVCAEFLCRRLCAVHRLVQRSGSVEHVHRKAICSWGCSQTGFCGW